MAQRGQKSSYEQYSRNAASYTGKRSNRSGRDNVLLVLPTTDSHQYGRENYGSAAGSHARTASKRRASVAKRVAIGVASVLGALVLAVGAYALWFSLALNDALSPSKEASELLAGQLVDAPLDKPFYTLLLGSDSREGSADSPDGLLDAEDERSDVIILARIDASNKLVTLVSVPRDTPYTLDDGSVVKINEAYRIGGAALSVKAVSEVTGVDIAHYAEVRVSGLEALVDSLGGVDVYVDRAISTQDTLTKKRYKIEAGWQHIDGHQAQAFARQRHAYEGTAEGQDYHRQGNVRALLEAIIRKVLDRPVTDLPATVLDVAQYVTTDLKAMDLVSLGISFSGGGITMYNCTGPSDGAEVAQYDNLWFCYPNPEGWAELMRQVDEGIEPGEIDFAATQQTL